MTTIVTIFHVNFVLLSSRYSTLSLFHRGSNVCYRNLPCEVSAGAKSNGSIGHNPVHLQSFVLRILPTRKKKTLEPLRRRELYSAEERAVLCSYIIMNSVYLYLLQIQLTGKQAKLLWHQFHLLNH